MDKFLCVTVLTGGGATARPDLVAVEEPLEIRIRYGPLAHRNRHRLTVTLRTPGHDEELALGLLRSEGVIDDLADVVRFERTEENVMSVDLVPEVPVEVPELGRNFASTGSCGLCGKTMLDGLETLCEPMTSLRKIPAEVLLDLPRKLREHQTTFDSTGSLHAAGLFDAEGRFLAIREDVGRHNAVDKVLGFQWKKGGVHDAILVLSGRAGYELVQKAVRFGVPVIVAIGAPTTLAVELAERMNVTLLGFVRDGRGNCYTHPARIMES